MGYTTDFEGHFSITPPLKPEHRTSLKAFAETRRYKRDALKTALRPDPRREAVGLRVGPDGGYFVNEEGFRGQGSYSRYNDCVEYNYPPSGQPGLWCQWTPSEDGTVLEWDRGEKFYDYVQWLHYLIHHFLMPWGYRLDGAVKWWGEERSDIGTIHVENNIIDVWDGHPNLPTPKIVQTFDAPQIAEAAQKISAAAKKASKPRKQVPIQWVVLFKLSGGSGFWGPYPSRRKAREAARERRTTYAVKTAVRKLIP